MSETQSYKTVEFTLHELQQVAYALQDREDALKFMMESPTCPPTERARFGTMLADVQCARYKVRP
jgi:hypothetical protein